MKLKTLEHLDIVARPDLVAASGCVLHVFISCGPKICLVPLNKIQKDKPRDFTYIEQSKYPPAAYLQGQPINVPTSVVGRLRIKEWINKDETLDVELYEQPLDK